MIQKEYQKPEIRVITIHHEQHILSESGDVEKIYEIDEMEFDPSVDRII